MTAGGTPGGLPWSAWDLLVSGRSDALQASPYRPDTPWWGVRTDWLRRVARAPVRCRTPFRNRQRGSAIRDCESPGPYPPDRVGDRDLRTGGDGSDGAVGVRR
ncbi:hypothetical protein GCM10010503_05520 [Streptomyces lucensis JCM 4490]|uniref:Uncharacterized protein n=1 Tax=Streptomyces lucensis JCM 4490 TaxID=1306176 RepID=A0A918ITY1_9ACTN|nr:hypothetical protein GCM10010503_05520 [Streptomyces lucensis JCM 4490]